MSTHTNNVIKIINFLREIYVAPDVMHENTAINNDLKLAGIDADDFLERFIDRFHVDMSDFPYDKYFHAEGDWRGFFLFQWFVSLPKKPDLTIGHLAKAVEVGKWIEEEEKPSEEGLSASRKMRH